MAHYVFTNSAFMVYFIIPKSPPFIAHLLFHILHSCMTPNSILNSPAFMAHYIIPNAAFMAHVKYSQF